MVTDEKQHEENEKDSAALVTVDLSAGPDLECPTTLKAIEYHAAKGKARESEKKLLEAHTNSRIIDESVESAMLHKFEFLQKLRKSATGTSWKAIDKRTRRTVCVKKVFQAFRNAEDAQRTYREIMLLRQLEGHDNLVHLSEIYISKEPVPGRDVYLTFPYMETDLYNVIRARILESKHKRYVLYQLLRGLKWLHSAGVVHRDIRPSNLLLNRDCHVKICGLHSARRVRVDGVGESAVGADRAGLTNYVGHRWYRAPELLLGSETYGTGVDIWSTGCILGELVADDGRPIFPGTSHYDQVNKILGTTGRPSKEDIRSLRSPLAADFIKDRDVTHPRAMTEIFPTAGPKALDLLRMMLTFNSERRVNVVTALRHPYVLEFHNPEDEPSYEKEMAFRFYREQKKEREAEAKAEAERAARLKRAHEKKLLHQKTEHHASAELEALMGVQEDDVQELELAYQVCPQLIRYVRGIDDDKQKGGRFYGL